MQMSLHSASPTTLTQSTLFWILFASLSSGWATTTTRLLSPKGKQALFSQVHNDALPVR